MPESQNIAYKPGWHDDYLKWVCGFANATLEIIFGKVLEEFGNEMVSEAGRMEPGNKSGKMKFIEGKSEKTI